jgi:hypothetical protein
VCERQPEKKSNSRRIAITENLFADTHSKSGVEASDDDDYFEKCRCKKCFGTWELP